MRSAFSDENRVARPTPGTRRNSPSSRRAGKVAEVGLAHGAFLRGDGHELEEAGAGLLHDDALLGHRAGSALDALDRFCTATVDFDGSEPGAKRGRDLRMPEVSLVLSKYISPGCRSAPPR